MADDPVQGAVMRKIWLWTQKNTLSVLLVIIVLFLAFTFLLLHLTFNHTMTAVDEQANIISGIVVNQVRGELDSMLMSISDLATAVSTNILVTQFANIGAPENAKDHYALYELVRSFSSHRSLMSSNDFVWDFAVYFPLGDVLVRSGAYCRTKDFFLSTHLGNNTAFSQWIRLISSHYRGQFVSELSTDNMLVYIQSLTFADVPSANIMVFLDRHKIMQRIASIENESMSVFALLDDMLLYGDTTENGTIDQLTSYIRSSDSLANGMTVTRIKSMFIRGVTYYIITNNNSNYADSTETALRKFYKVSIYTATLIIILSLSLFLLWVLPPTIKLINRMRNHNQKQDTVKLVKKAIEQVLLRNKIVENIADHWQVLKDALLDRLARSDIPMDSVLHSLSMYSIQFSDPYFIIVIFSVSLPRVDTIHQYTVASSISSLLPHSKNECFSLGEGKFALLVNFSERAFACRNQVELIRQDISSNLLVPVTACIGSIQEGANGIRQSYEDAAALMEYTIFTGEDATLQFDDYKNSENTYVYTMETELQLLASVRVGDDELAANILDRVYEENFQKRQLHPDIARLLLSELTATALKLIRDHDCPSSPKDIYESIVNSKTVIDIFAALRNIYIGACTQNAIRPDQYRKQSIINYINKNFTDPDFSVSKMAEDINLSPNYLSAQFRTLFNTTIISYITSMRTERAAELLDTTASSINEIAFKCGFSGSDALNRSFKRKFHITPSKYRRNSQQI